ncbi:hypothetical protein DYB28_010271 [Aphanomyces astaci]|uniref:Uncharacterized protein n=1 Tax=Aphanomyces astaci TaxID=112090 RepID=A0A9X8E8Z1_APHAT|nr:hypothetical protein DYB28_010271 [Aphanomyces astaci]
MERNSPQLMDNHVLSARPDESMGVEAITDHVKPSRLFGRVPIHQPIVEHHQHLTVLEPNLPFSLAPVVHHDETMEIDATDERPSLTMPPILTLDGPPPIRSILDDFGEMETDDNSIMQPTTESDVDSPFSTDLANTELRISLQRFSDHVSAQVLTLRASSLEHQAATTDLSHRVDETLSSTRAWQLAATDELVHLGNAVDTVAERNKTLTQDVSSNQLLHERVSSLVHDKTLLQDRVLLLEARIDQLSLDFSSRLAQASIPAPEPSSGYPFQLPSELTALLTKMSSEMADGVHIPAT